ncbi:hypothetical protein [Streptomyces sp. AC555_RSS877]|nr:hypothetical protein [Streptomyces sp. AC555_RSS877]
MPPIGARIRARYATPHALPAEELGIREVAGYLRMAGNTVRRGA